MSFWKNLRQYQIDNEANAQFKHRVVCFDKAFSMKSLTEPHPETIVDTDIGMKSHSSGSRKGQLKNAPLYLRDGIFARSVPLGGDLMEDGMQR